MSQFAEKRVAIAKAVWDLRMLLKDNLTVEQLRMQILEDDARLFSELKSCYTKINALLSEQHEWETKYEGVSLRLLMDAQSKATKAVEEAEAMKAVDEEKTLCVHFAKRQLACTREQLQEFADYEKWKRDAKVRSVQLAAQYAQLRLQHGFVMKGISPQDRTKFPEFDLFFKNRPVLADRLCYDMEMKNNMFYIGLSKEKEIEAGRITKPTIGLAEASATTPVTNVATESEPPKANPVLADGLLSVSEQTEDNTEEPQLPSTAPQGAALLNQLGPAHPPAVNQVVATTTGGTNPGLPGIITPEFLPAIGNVENDVDNIITDRENGATEIAKDHGAQLTTKVRAVLSQMEMTNEGKDILTAINEIEAAMPAEDLEAKETLVTGAIERYMNAQAWLGLPSAEESALQRAASPPATAPLSYQDQAKKELKMLKTDLKNLKNVFTQIKQFIQANQLFQAQLSSFLGPVANSLARIPAISPVVAASGSPDQTITSNPPLVVDKQASMARMPKRSAAAAASGPVDKQMRCDDMVTVMDDMVTVMGEEWSRQKLITKGVLLDEEPAEEPIRSNALDFQATTGFKDLSPHIPPFSLERYHQIGNSIHLPNCWCPVVRGLLSDYLKDEKEPLRKKVRENLRSVYLTVKKLTREQFRERKELFEAMVQRDADQYYIWTFVSNKAGKEKVTRFAIFHREQKLLFRPNYTTEGIGPGRQKKTCVPGNHSAEAVT
jgi:hypothetical protein